MFADHHGTNGLEGVLRTLYLTLVSLPLIMGDHLLLAIRGGTEKLIPGVMSS